MLLVGLIILLIVIILLNYFKLYEPFIVPQNSDKIDQSKTPPSEDIQEFEKIINETYKENIDMSNLVDYTEDLNENFTKQLRNFILDKVKYEDLAKSNYTIDLSIPFKNVKYKFNTETIFIDEKPVVKDLNEIILKFNSVMSINNLYKFGKILSFSIKNVSIIMKIKSSNPNIKLIESNPITNYKDEYFKFLRYEILDINIEKDVEYDSLFKPQDKLYENYFRITNILHLLTPFKSSYDEMLITEKMRIDYEKALPDIKDIQAPIYKPFL